MSNPWYYSVAGSNERLGPISDAELRAMAADGRLTTDSLIWKEGMADWVPASSAKGLFQAKTSAPPPLSSSPASASPPPLPPPPTGAPGHGPAAGPAALPRPASRPPRARATHGGSAGIPVWAKIAGGVVAALVVLGIIGGAMSDGGGGGGRGIGGGSGYSAVGEWYGENPGPDGAVIRTRMTLTQDGVYQSRQLVYFTPSGNPLSMDFSGSWEQNGNRLTTNAAGYGIQHGTVTFHGPNSFTVVWANGARRVFRRTGQR